MTLLDLRRDNDRATGDPMMSTPIYARHWHYPEVEPSHMTEVER